MNRLGHESSITSRAIQSPLYRPGHRALLVIRAVRVVGGTEGRGEPGIANPFAAGGCHTKRLDARPHFESTGGFPWI